MDMCAKVKNMGYLKIHTIKNSGRCVFVTRTMATGNENEK